MKSLIEMLFDGDISVAENLRPTGQEYKEIKQKIHDEFDYFKGRLSDEDFKRLDDLRGLFCDSANMELKAAFSYGIKFGVVLMLEGYSGMSGFAG